MDLIIVAVLIFFVFKYTGLFDAKKFIEENTKYFYLLKESDYEFYLKAKYGTEVNTDVAFMGRIKNGAVAGGAIMLFNVASFSYITFIICIVIGYFVFKMPYNSLKNYYKQHLHEIDMTLPYYLKSLEILIQHYTVPNALLKSIDTAPELFKDGLRELVASINAGDSSVEPYMTFAKTYPVRDSMRMMRLLYRLGLGSNDNKQEQLSMLAKNVSALQNKSREMKYKARLAKMESMTTIMLVVTGGGCMVLMVVSIAMSMFG